MDSKKRSLYKSISWHVLHMLSVATVALVVTGSVKIAAILASAELAWETVMYYLHERAWSKVEKV